MGKFYFTRKRAEAVRMKGQKIVKSRLKNKRIVFKLRRRR